MSAAKQTPRYLTDDERRSFAASRGSALGISDSDRLNALITLIGGHYAFPVFLEMSELFKDGRRGLDAFFASNPSLLGSKAPSDQAHLLAPAETVERKKTNL